MPVFPDRQGAVEFRIKPQQVRSRETVTNKGAVDTSDKAHGIFREVGSFGPKLGRGEGKGSTRSVSCGHRFIHGSLDHGGEFCARDGVGLAGDFEGAEDE